MVILLPMTPLQKNKLHVELVLVQPLEYMCWSLVEQLNSLNCKMFMPDHIILQWRTS